MALISVRATHKKIEDTLPSSSPPCSSPIPSTSADSRLSTSAANVVHRLQPFLALPPLNYNAGESSDEEDAIKRVGSGSDSSVAGNMILLEKVHVIWWLKVSTLIYVCRHI